MLDEREAPIAPGQESQAFNRKKLWQRAAIVSAGPLANLGLAVLLYAAAHWIGVQEPKALIGPPAAGSLAERAGLRAGDWVRAIATGEAGGDAEWRDLRSLTDLRWEVTQAALQQQALRLQVSDRDGRGSRTVSINMAGVDAREVDAALSARIGLGQAWREPVLGEVKAGGPAAAAAGLQRGDRVLSIDDQPVADAQHIVEASCAAACVRASRWPSSGSWSAMAARWR